MDLVRNGLYFSNCKIKNKSGLPTRIKGQILNIWKMRNMSIWLVDPFQIGPIKSAYSAIYGFDWVLVSRVVCIIQIFTICLLSVCNPYRIKYNESLLVPTLETHKTCWYNILAYPHDYWFLYIFVQKKLIYDSLHRLMTLKYVFLRRVII